MKKILLLSVLILFSCSKDSKEEATPGNEIIGLHKLKYTVDFTFNPDGSLVSINYNDGPNNQSGYTCGYHLTEGTIEFYSNNKAKLNITFCDTYNRDVNGVTKAFCDNGSNSINFDWFYENNRWKLIDIYGEESYVTFFDNEYKLTRGNFCYYYF